MGIVNLSVKIGLSIVVLYVVALIVQGNLGELTNFFKTMQGFIQDIASMEKNTLVGLAFVGIFVFILFSEA